MNDITEVLSALIDGERLDPDVLARVLEDSGARALLVDLVRLRHQVGTEDPLPASLRALRSQRRGLWARAVPLPVAAAFALLATSAALLLPTRTDPERPGAAHLQESAPSVNRIVQFEPGVDWHRSE